MAFCSQDQFDSPSRLKRCAESAAGLAEGEAQEKFATAKRMLALGKSLQDIMLITDLPMSKIQELQSEVKPA